MNLFNFWRRCHAVTEELKNTISSGCLYQKFNPLALWAFPLYSLPEHKGRGWDIFLFRLYFDFVCNTPQYYWTRLGERIKRGISCFSIRVDFTLLHYNIREGANKLSDNTLSKCSIYVVSKRATSFFYSNRGSRRVVFGHLGRNIPKDFYRTKIGALLSSREFSVALFFDWLRGSKRYLRCRNRFWGGRGSNLFRKPFPERFERRVACGAATALRFRPGNRCGCNRTSRRCNKKLFLGNWIYGSIVFDI